MTDKVPTDQNNEGHLLGIPDEPYYNEKGEVDFVWKEKPVKPG